MRKGRYKHAQTTTRPTARINEQIRAAEVRVIDTEGKQLGIMPTPQALAEAKSKALDMVEIAPKAVPPVVKLINYDKYRYQLEKLARQQRKHQKKVEVKGVRLSARIGEHDLKVKAERAEKFLKEGNKVKIDLLLRGRERGNASQAIEQIHKFLKLLALPYTLEQAPARMGHMINAILSPKN